MHRSIALALTLAFAPMAAAIPPVRPVVRDVAPTTANIKAAVARSLPLLAKAAKGHSDQRSCFTCHSHGVPMLALATARDRGFDVPAKRLADLVAFLGDDLERNRARFLKGQGPGPSPAGGETDNTGYMLLALAAVGHAPDANTAAVVHYTLGKPKDRGHWATHGARPPSEASHFAPTALAIRGLRTYATPAQREEADARIAAARAWLVKTPPRDAEDRVFRLLGLKAAGATDAEVKAAADDLLKTQRPGGGFAQTDRLDADAYATGSALYALHTAGGVKHDDPANVKGVAFLLGTQRDDGSWFVRSRSRPFQTYFETGFPHGKHQFISTAATGWATTALALAWPKS